MAKQNFLTVPEEQLFLNTLKTTGGDYEAACAAIPHVDPAAISKEGAFKRVGLEIPKPEKKSSKVDPLA